jgi:hypothetical protein
MKTKRMLLAAGGLSAIVLAASGVRAMAQAAPPPIDLRPMILTNLSGNLLIHHGLPCNQVVDVTTPVIANSLLEITPAGGLSGRDPSVKTFMLTRMGVFFAPFTVDARCLNFHDKRRFSDVGIQLVHPVSFTGVLGVGGYEFRIPKADFLISMAVIDNKLPESGFRHPSEDVTGFIDLAHGTARLHFVLENLIHFQFPEGCQGTACLINEDGRGTVGADIAGTLVFPDGDGDGIPDRGDACPLVANITCTSVGPQGLFRVAVPTSCPAQTIRLGSFQLGNGEVVQIEETGQPGVQLINEVGSGRIKHFQVGKGQAIVTATDASGNVASAACR